MKKLLSGNEAFARGAWEAGVDFATGYPGTPSTEILENLVLMDGPRSQWSINEKVALEVAAGASWAGGRVMVTMKHVGLNVAADPLFTLSYTGVRGGLVIVNADDPQLFSSQNEQDNRHYARAAKVPMLEPSDSQEAKDWVGTALELSEGFDTPVLLRTTTRLSHSKSLVTLGEREKRSVEGFLKKDPEKLVMVPEFGRRRHRVVEERLKSLADLAENSPLNVEIPGRGKGLGIISSGIPFQYAREAFPEASFLKLGMVFPLPKEKILDFIARHRRVIVVEELDPFIEGQIRFWGGEVEGAERRSLLGELNPDLVRRAWGKGRKAAGVPVPENLPPRPPVLCPGCPHRGMFTLLKKKGIFVTGDIGCYTLAAIPPMAALHTCLCMGASIGKAQGMEWMLSDEKKRKVAAVIGDSTFFHSGITALADLVYNGANTVTIVLDNRTTAMTGRQHHPGTGRTLQGDEAPAASIAAIGKALGVKKVIETDAYDYGKLEKQLDRVLKTKGPVLIVNKGPCVLITRKPLAPPLKVDPSLCDGCRRCLRVACPSLLLGKGGKKAKVTIDPLTCWGCNLCADECTRLAIHSPGKGGRSKRK